MLIIEALVVGLVLSALMMLVYSFTTITSVVSACIVGFVLGAGTHLIFEYSGANKWYCDNGNACKI